MGAAAGVDLAPAPTRVAQRAAVLAVALGPPLAISLAHPGSFLTVLQVRSACKVGHKAGMPVRLALRVWPRRHCGGLSEYASVARLRSGCGLMEVSDLSEFVYQGQAENWLAWQSVLLGGPGRLLMWAAWCARQWAGTA